MTKFYDNLNELNKLWGDIRKYKDTKKGRDLRRASRDKLRYRKRYNKLQRELSKIRKRSKNIYESDVSSRQKRTAIERNNRKMNDAVRRLTNLSEKSF